MWKSSPTAQQTGKQDYIKLIICICRDWVKWDFKILKICKEKKHESHKEARNKTGLRILNSNIIKQKENGEISSES
jgi:hypothetical protein